MLATKNTYAKKAFYVFMRLMKRNGGDPYLGRSQVSCLRKAGFSRLISSASYDCWTPTPEIARRVGHFMKAYFKSEEFVGPRFRHPAIRWIGRDTQHELAVNCPIKPSAGVDRVGATCGGSIQLTRIGY